jgi:plasmid replication initiation protein
MWMRRRPPRRSGADSGYRPAYADGAALRAIADQLTGAAAAAVAAVAPDAVRVPVVSGVPAPVPSAHAVRLGFADATDLELDARDPWAIALRAVAAEMLATRGH